jgi:glutamate racemase
MYGIAAPELVEFVERRFISADEKEKSTMARKYIEQFRTSGVDAVVLGCTHFLFLLEEFRREAAPGITVFDSVDGIARRIESLLDENDGALRAEKKPIQNQFLLTGCEPADASWQGWAEQLGFRLSLLDDNGRP